MTFNLQILTYKIDEKKIDTLILLLNKDYHHHFDDKISRLRFSIFADEKKSNK